MLAQSHMQMLHERELSEAAQKDLATLQPQVISLRKELDELSQRRDKVQAELDLVQRGMNDIATQPDQAHAAGSGSTTSLGNSEEVIIATAQKTLTKFGYGPLAADGIMGPSTRRAIEEFQYKNGLPVTRELDTPTLQRLGDSNSVAAVE